MEERQCVLYGWKKDIFDRVGALERIPNTLEDF